jgi:hypothetical protein
MRQRRKNSDEVAWSRFCFNSSSAPARVSRESSTRSGITKLRRRSVHAEGEGALDSQDYEVHEIPLPDFLVAAFRSGRWKRRGV